MQSLKWMTHGKRACIATGAKPALSSADGEARMRGGICCRALLELDPVAGDGNQRLGTTGDAKRLEDGRDVNLYRTF